MGVRLPAEYQEVEYLDSPGLCYVQKDISLAVDDVVSADIVFQFLEAESQQWVAGWFVGSGIVSNLIEFGIYTGSLYTRDGATFELLEGSGNTGKYKASIQNVTVLTNATMPWRIFGRGGTNVVVNELNNPLCRIWRNKVWINGNKVLDWIPCYRKSDNEPGMYDLISKTFYTNQGTGEFLVGPDVVDHISPRLMDRRRVLIAKLTSLFKNIISSQSGLVTFNTNFAKPMKVTCEFSPKQDLHGYDNPWPAGGGKNLFNESTLFDAASYPNAGAYGYYYADNLVLKPNTAYTVSAFITGTKPGNEINYFFGTASGSGQRTIIINGSADTSGTLTTGEDGIIKIGINKGAASTIQDALDLIKNNVKIQLEEGSTATAYAPYENICPSSGWTGANIVRVGANLLTTLPIKRIVHAVVNSSTKVITASNYRDTLVYAVPKGLLYEQHNAPEECFCGFSNNPDLGIGDGVDDTWAFRYASNQTYNNNDYSYIYVDSVVNNGNPRLSVSVNAYSSVLPLSVPQTLPIPFNNPGTYDFLPIQAGTGDPSPEHVRPITPGLTLTRDDNTTLEVWGGSLTVNSDGTGSLASNMAVVDLGDFTYTKNTISGTEHYYFTSNNNSAPDASGCSNYIADKSVCTNYKCISLLETQDNAFSVYRGAARINVLDFAKDDYTVEQFKEAMTGVKVAYVLITSTTYSLSVAETSRAFEALGLGKNLGPLYGGTVTINEDESVDVVSNFRSIYLTAQNTSVRSTVLRIVINDRAGYTKIFCNKCTDQVSFAAWNSGAPAIIQPSSSSDVLYCRLLPASEETEESLASYLDGSVQVVYKSNSQQVYHFSSIADFKSFIGSNNIWSDLNGPITVEYYNNKKE